MKAVRVLLRGRVQGVGFRRSAADRAALLGVAGWVRNRGDGALELQVQGSPAAVDAMLAWLHDGPTFARVESLEVNSCEPDAHSGFRVR